MMVFIVSLTICGPTRAAEPMRQAKDACFNGENAALPQDAYLLPVKRAAELQKTLDQHRKVKLEPGASYVGRWGPIRLASGQQLYGLAGTKVNRVVVEGGATGVVLQGVVTEALSFLASDQVTSWNCFRRITGPVTVRNAKLEDNLFVDLANTQLDIDTRRSGYLRNNRFIRVMTHATSPAIRMQGDLGRLSGGNVFLWVNILTPHGDGIIIDAQDDVTFVGLDSESWNWSNRAKYPAMMSVSNTGTLRVIAANGGDAKSSTGRYLDTGADEVQLLGTSLERVGNPALTLQPQVKRYFTSSIQHLNVNDLSPSGFRLSAFSGGKSVVQSHGIDVRKNALSVADLTSFRELMVRRSPGRSWDRPVLAPIPDPAGADWKVGLASKPDNTDFLQRLVDTQGVARVPAGIYYISRPIKLRANQGLVGEGAARTAIIAMKPTIDMIVGDENITKQATYSFTLADITLQGGRNGIHHNVNGVQFNRIVLSHVTFRDMSESGIFIDGIYGWDNNFIDNVNFYRCREAGIKQRPNPLYVRGDDPGMSYMDKNVFYRCQFVESGIGVDLRARRANNLNSFVDSVFRGNSHGAVVMTNNSSSVFANTEFAGNGGNPVISSNRPTYFINSYFRALKDNVAMLPEDATCEGCVFQSDSAYGSTILAKRSSVESSVLGGSRVFLYNSKSVDMPLGGVESAFIVNSILAKDAPITQIATIVDKGVVQVLVPGLPDPVGRSLFRREYN